MNALRDAQNPFTDSALSSRITRAIMKVAEERGRSREEIRKELSDKKKANGVFSRSARNRKRKFADHLAMDESNQSQPSEQAYSNSDFEAIENGQHVSEKLQDLLEESDSILNGDPSLLIDDALLKVASVYTNVEILEEINSRCEQFKRPAISPSLLSDRLWKALSNVAAKQGRTRDEVKAELESARRTNGVKKRKNEFAAKSRATSNAAKRVKLALSNADATKYEDQGMDSKDNTKEDPLGDLEAIARGEEESTLNAREDAEVEGEIDQKSGSTNKKTPKPFDGSPVGYLAGQPGYIPGFRVYE